VQRLGSIECLNLPTTSLISSTGDAALRIIFQILGADVVPIDCVLPLRAATNYIAVQRKYRVAAIR
jgi:hypothetical protein